MFYSRIFLKNKAMLAEWRKKRLKEPLTTKKASKDKSWLVKM